MAFSQPNNVSCSIVAVLQSADGKVSTSLCLRHSLYVFGSCFTSSRHGHSLAAD